MEQDTRYKQADKEAWLTLALYGGYFVWWYVCAYSLGGGDPEKYSYILGFPAWFFYSCIVGYPLLSLVLWVVVRVFFKDMPLDADQAEQPQQAEIPQAPAKEE